MEIDFTQLMVFELGIKGASGYTHKDLVKVLEHITEEKAPIASIITHTYKLEDIGKAFNKAISIDKTGKS